MSTSKEKNGIILNRISLNQSELANLQKLLVANPTAKVVFVTDLHEVVFDRLPGDYARFNQLSLKDKAFLPGTVYVLAHNIFHTNFLAGQNIQLQKHIYYQILKMLLHSN